MKTRIIQPIKRTNLVISAALILLMGLVATTSPAATARGATGEAQKTILHHAVIEPIGGGFNPEFFGFRINGDVVTGNNDCYSSAAAAELRAHVEDNVLYITPVVSHDRSASLVCPTHHDPQWKHLSLDVRYSRKEVSKIMILNSNTQGGTLTIVP